MKVLIADDSSIARSRIVNVCKDRGYEILEAGDGQEAYNMIIAEKPDLLMCDINMPYMSGMELFEKLHQENALPITVAVTTDAVPTHMERAKQLGVRGWCVKPLDPDKLVKILAKVEADIQRDSQAG